MTTWKPPWWPVEVQTTTAKEKHKKWCHELLIPSKWPGSGNITASERWYTYADVIIVKSLQARACASEAGLKQNQPQRPITVGNKPKNIYIHSSEWAIAPYQGPCYDDYQ